MEEGFSDQEREKEMERVERLVSVQEIFIEGFKMGLANAGIKSNPYEMFNTWLDKRLESRE